MCMMCERRPSWICNRHLLHQDWFYSVSTEPLMTLTVDALRNELNQRYNTATRKTLAFIWPCSARTRACVRETLQSHSSTSHVLIWTVKTPDHKDALWMFYVARCSLFRCAVLSAPRHCTTPDWTTNFPTACTITYAVEDHAKLSNVVYLYKLNNNILNN